MSDIDQQETIDAVLEYWFSGCEEDPHATKKRQKLWYGFNEKTDAEIRETFGTLTEQASIDLHTSWAQSPRGALALVIVLDQFSRQIYRGSSRAFMQDPLARAIAFRAISQEFHHQLSIPGQIFLIHPFHHSETLSDHDLAVKLVEELRLKADQVWSEWLDESLRFMRSHREIIERFGRFPHRNEVMRRPSSDEELEYLETGSRYGQ